MNGDLDEVSMRIGLLTGQVEALNNNMEHMISWMKSSNETFQTSLTKHTEADAVNFTTLTTKVDGVLSWKKKVMTVGAVCSVIVTAVFQIGLAFIQRGK